MNRRIIHSLRLVSEGVIDDDAWILLEEGRIGARGTGTGWHQHTARAEVTDGTGLIATPGFIDIHVHGGGGASHDEGAAATTVVLDTHESFGTTRALCSLVTGDLDAMTERVRTLARAAAADDRILGIHLEGPFLDPGHRGAHDPALLRAPLAEYLAPLLAAGGGAVRQITLAPELAGGAEAIPLILRAGARVAVGHTNADERAATEAFAAGASLLTHAFNAMEPLHHRAPGPVAAACAQPHVTLEVIADGVHVAASVITMLFRSAPGRVALVTDAMAAAGAADGDYRLGALDVRVRNGVARLVEGGAIAGSTLTMSGAVRFAVQAAGIPLAEAVAAATEVPARAIGVDSAFGTLGIGRRADLVLLDAELEVAGVFRDGEIVRPLAGR